MARRILGFALVVGIGGIYSLFLAVSPASAEPGAACTRLQMIRDAEAQRDWVTPGIVQIAAERHCATGEAADDAIELRPVPVYPDVFRHRPDLACNTVYAVLEKPPPWPTVDVAVEASCIADHADLVTFVMASPQGCVPLYRAQILHEEVKDKYKHECAQAMGLEEKPSLASRANEIIGWSILVLGLVFVGIPALLFALWINWIDIWGE